MNKLNQILLFILILLLTGGFFLYKEYERVKVDLKVSNQNNKALNDTIRVEKNKLNQYESSKQILITRNQELKDLNKDLFKEYKKIEGRVYQLQKSINKINNLLGETNSEGKKINDTTFLVKWSKDTTFNKENYRLLSGETTLLVKNDSLISSKHILTKDQIQFNLITGLREKDDKLEIFISSDYPNLVPEKIDGAIIDPKNHPLLKSFNKKDRFVLGIGIGYGFNVNQNGIIRIGPNIGINLGYRLFSF